MALDAPHAGEISAPCFVAEGIAGGELRATIRRYSSRRFANLAIWRPGRNGQWYPTRGLSIDVAALPSLRAAVDALEIGAAVSPAVSPAALPG